jgi:hypothetical protein
MASLKVEDAIYHLDREFKRSLDDTMQQFAPGSSFRSDELFRFFLKRIYHHCSIWEDIPDSCVRVRSN